MMNSCSWCKKILASNEVTLCKIINDEEEERHSLCVSCHLTGHACQSSCPSCWYEYGEIYIRKNDLCSGCLQPLRNEKKFDSNEHCLCEYCSQCLLCSFRSEMNGDLFRLSYREHNPRMQNILYNMQRCVLNIEIEREPCSICMETLYGQTTNPVRTLDVCQHRFHEFCIEKWFSRNRCCPCCRYNYQNDVDQKSKRSRRDYFHPFQLQNSVQQPSQTSMDIY